MRVGLNAVLALSEIVHQFATQLSKLFAASPKGSAMFKGIVHDTEISQQKIDGIQLKQERRLRRGHGLTRSPSPA